jgi:hypothetical protein
MNKLELIPEEKLKRYLKKFPTSTVICNCGKINTTMFIPYAYDRDNNDVIYVGKCEKCGELLFTKE